MHALKLIVAVSTDIVFRSLEPESSTVKSSHSQDPSKVEWSQLFEEPKMDKVDPGLAGTSAVDLFNVTSCRPSARRHWLPSITTLGQNLHLFRNNDDTFGRSCPSTNIERTEPTRMV